jgi:hypothetical protein
MKGNENGIFAHADLLQQGLATKGETLGFSVGLNAAGRPIINNVSELNVHISPSGELPPDVYNAVKQALGAQ